MPMTVAQVLGFVVFFFFLVAIPAAWWLGGLGRNKKGQQHK